MKAELTLSPEALEVWKLNWRENEKTLGPGGLLEEMPDWGSKLMGNVLRVAGVIHVAKYPNEFLRHPISVDTMRAAISVGKYLVPHARAAYGIASQNQDIHNAKKILEWVKDNRLEQFTQNECHRRFKSTITTAPELAKALKVLEDRNYLRQWQEQPQKGGRPSKKFSVNPKFLNGT